MRLAAALAERLGPSVRYLDLLQQPPSHSCYLPEHRDLAAGHNERLQFPRHHGVLLALTAPPPRPPPGHSPGPRRGRSFVAACWRLLLRAGGGLGGWTWFGSVRNRPGPLPKATEIVVPRGGLDRLAAALADAGVIDSALKLRAAAWLSRHDGTLHAAEFSFPEHASLNQVLAILRTAHPVDHYVTIPEGRTAHQIG